MRFIASFLLIVQSSAITITGTQPTGTSISPETVSVLGLKELYIVCDSSSFQFIYDHPREDTSISIDVAYAGSTWTDVEMRIRRDSNLDHPKKSLQIISCDKPLIDGRQVLNLNAAYLDHSYVHEVLSSLMLRQSDQAASQAEHARLYLNGDYLGLYILSENVDELFLSTRGLDPQGNLYKAALEGACLSTNDDVDHNWEKKTNQVLPRDDLIELIENLNTLSDPEYLVFAQTGLDYDRMVNILAMNMLLANGATYYHNYYMYHDIRGSGKWTMFPGDMDKSLSHYGIDYSYQRTSPSELPDNPFVERALISTAILGDVRSRIDTLSQTIFNNGYADVIIDSLQALIAASVQADTTDQIPDTTYWKSKLLQEKEYIQARTDTLLYQIDNWPRTFRVDKPRYNFTDRVYLSWHPALDPDGDPISYSIEYDTSSSFSAPATIGGITDIAHTLPSTPPPGMYYWRVAASDGSHSSLGWDSWNSFQVISGSTLPATIATDVALTRESSPYTACDDVRIEVGGILRAGPGIEIRLPESATIYVAGRLEFHGTADDPIRIRPDVDADLWGAITFTDVDSSSISHVQIERALVGGDPATQPAAVNGHNSTFTIENTAFMECRAGIVVTGGSVVVRQCRFLQNNTGEAINVRGGIGIIEDCEIYAVPGDNDGIDFDGVASGVIRNNLIDGIGDDGIDIGAGSVDILITGNQVYGCNDKGISIGEVSDVGVEYNVIGSCGMGIAVKDESTAFIDRNTFYDNDTSVAAYIKFDQYGGGTAHVRNSIIAGSRGPVVYSDEASLIDVVYSLCDTEPLIGEGNLYDDPLFVNQVLRDFHLQAGSPCIDAGDPESPLDPDATRADMGAFYFEQELNVVTGNILPGTPALHQNFPNPFNPVTTIRYDLPRRAKVTLTIYDILGREVAVLINGEQGPGYHSVIWNGRNERGQPVSTGVYLYRIQAEGFAETRKMLLLR
ncbi:MAG: CotH kinase family protein [Candidatus Marinimicrobia bacterium]|nr:CotH kinase family protein [Candidatus Neomarinimicrobiota bacterium]